MSLMRVFALLLMLITIVASAMTCTMTEGESGSTPWIVLLVGMVLSGMLYNRGKKK